MGFHSKGFTLVELLLSVALGAMLLLGFQRLINTSLSVDDDFAQRLDATNNIRFAMARMTQAVAGSQRLVLPLADNPATNWPEHVREQSVPPTAPIGDSSLATAVLAVTLPPSWDANQDGIPDVDNDGDGRIDEDWGYDNNNDGDDGIWGIDDDGDGSVDEPAFGTNDDESGGFDDDPLDGFDKDRDGSVDEDTGEDMNFDFQPGIAGVDDDGDGDIDEGNRNDDDEDGQSNEDWQDSLVFYLQGSSLIERRAVPWDTDSDSDVDGRDFVESVIMENVAHLRFERLLTTANQIPHVSIELSVLDNFGQISQLATTVRVGSETLAVQ